MEKVKKCPVCGSRNLKYMLYAPSEKDAPELWDFDEWGGFSPMMYFKRIQCECGATVSGLSLTIDGAIDFWNGKDKNTGRRYPLQFFGEETITDVEE